MSKILIVEDDTNMVRHIKKWLESEHYSVEEAESGPAGLDLMRAYNYDVIILDVNLPRLNGFEVCKQYRTAGGQSPILMLTGRTEMADKEAGFTSGVDDFLTKPFHMKELSLRIAALLKRARNINEVVLQVGPLRLDPKAHSVKRNGEEIQLQRMEFQLLEFFMRHKGQTFSPEAILSAVWSAESETSTESLRTTIRKLRQKIDPKGSPSFISNVHGVGYKLDESE